jgi:hypothetical protein
VLLGLIKVLADLAPCKRGEDEGAVAGFSVTFVGGCAEPWPARLAMHPV